MKNEGLMIKSIRKQLYFLFLLDIFPCTINAVDANLHYNLLSAENASAPVLRGNTIIWSYAAPKKYTICVSGL